jgi:hypothetical protein
MKFALQPLSTSPHRRSDVDLAMTAFCIVQSRKGNPFARSNVNMYKPLFPSMFLVFWICRPVSIYRHLPTCTVTVHPRSLTTFVGLALNLLVTTTITTRQRRRRRSFRRKSPSTRFGRSFPSASSTRPSPFYPSTLYNLPPPATSMSSYRLVTSELLKSVDERSRRSLKNASE